jgi:hypothetical protein
MGIPTAGSRREDGCKYSHVLYSAPCISQPGVVSPPHLFIFLPENTLISCISRRIREKSNMETHSPTCYAIFTNLDACLSFSCVMSVGWTLE